MNQHRRSLAQSVPPGIRKALRDNLPGGLYRVLRYPQDCVRVAAFLLGPGSTLSWRQRLALARTMYTVSWAVECSHSESDVLAFIRSMVALPPHLPGCVVEAGCYKGGSTAKFSVAARMAGRRLIVFDSFAGIPKHDEAHDRNIYGGEASFPEGSYRGALEEVRRNVSTFGAVDVCSFIPGWFEETMPRFSEPIAAIYLDVDLASSTRTCLKYLYPRLVPGGVLYSQDGHLPLVIGVFGDDRFWEGEVGTHRPSIEGLGTRKVIRIVKPDTRS